MLDYIKIGVGKYRFTDTHTESWSTSQLAQLVPRILLSSQSQIVGLKCKTKRATSSSPPPPPPPDNDPAGVRSHGEDSEQFVQPVARPSTSIPSSIDFPLEWHTYREEGVAKWPRHGNSRKRQNEERSINEPRDVSLGRFQDLMR